MKKALAYILIIISCGLLTGTCSDDDLSSASVITDPTNEDNEFDKWLEENYRRTYNISFRYKYEHVESDMTYDLVPAEMSHSIIIAKLVKYLWLDAYVETAGLTFVRTYVPRIIMVIGSAAWDVNGTFKLGTAEGGLKITLYVGNWLDQWFRVTYNDPSHPDQGYTINIDMANLNFYYLHTIHHEFAHILHQTKDFPAEFKTISAGNYAPGTWSNRTDDGAAALGFISAYAGSEPQEDFAETFAFYVTLSDDEWKARLEPAGEEGAAIIEQKLEIVKSYMQNTWNIDLDKLKSVLARKYTELYDVDWVNL